jgi:predicted O-methyltransferase YrrM
MYSKLQLAIKYLKYYFAASNGKGHGVHSPFVFDFITKILNDSRQFYAYQQIEGMRNALLHDERILTIQDFGAGSRIIKHNQRKVSSIASSSLKPKKFSQLLFRMVNYYQPQSILEIGTSLGITSSYLAAANSNARLITMEGATEVAVIAKENFSKQQLQNIQLVEGNFDETLTATIAQLSAIDFAFLDGNHRYQPTVHYFEAILPKLNEYSIVILDDVHWSEEMEQAWQYVQQHPTVTLTIDLFFIGIAFFRKENKVKQHFAVRF